MDNTTNQTHDWLIQVAQPEQSAAIADLHGRYISPRRPLSPVEVRFLVAYYLELIRRADSTVYLATKVDTVAGYCSLVAEQRQVLKHVAIAHPFLVSRMLGHMLHSSHIVKYFWRMFAGEFLGRKWKNKLEQYETTFELRAVAVDEKYRGQGISIALLSTALAQVQKAPEGSAIAWVAASNIASRRAFERVGFCLVGTKLESQQLFCLYRYQQEPCIPAKVNLGNEG